MEKTYYIVHHYVDDYVMGPELWLTVVSTEEEAKDYLSSEYTVKIEKVNVVEVYNHEGDL